ncbi:MAG: electron transfer flavoprotein subunit alpha/FixB family protein [Candidatus Neomarinimicrobiota bacterium]
MDILVVAENKNGGIHRMSWEALAAAQSLAKELDLTTALLVMGYEVSGAVETGVSKDVDELLVLRHPLLAHYSADGFSEALNQVIEQESPTYVFMGHTYMVRDFFPKVSGILNIPFFADNVGYRVENHSPVFIKQVFQGKLLADVVPTGDGPLLITFQSATFQADEVTEGSGAPVRDVSIDLDESAIKTHSEEPFQEAAGQVDLSSAELIVAVGRGIGKEENLPLIKKLADVLGAQLAASRPVVDAEWLPSFRQVGSSGQTVSPKLYLALGISGAIQHLVGMKGSQNIVVINKDPNAPFFEIADFGIVADIVEIVPKLTEAIQELKTSG